MPISRQRIFCTLAVLLASLVAGCKAQSSQTQTIAPAPAASSPAAKSTVDACKLLTGDEIKTIQNDSLKNVTLTTPTVSSFIVSQCFYATDNFINSVSLTVTQQSSNSGAENIREFWEQGFRGAGDHDKERERERDKKAKGAEEEEEGAPAERVNGIGEEAYAVGTAKFGALYVLKGNKILRISVGGSRTQPERIQKMKSLAQYAVSRL